jgi:transcriptional regulator with XRE-family HTH domain
VSEEFSRRLKSARKAIPMKAKELAARSGISASYLSQLESGQRDNPDQRLVEKFASELRVSKSWLLGQGEADTYAQPDPTPASRMIARDPPPPACQYPADCDLPAQLAEVRSDLADVRAQLHTLCGLLGGVLGQKLDDKPVARKAG